MSKTKPPIPPEIAAKWQRIVDILADVMTVPAALVMRAAPPEHLVLVTSAGKENPYETGMAFTLHTGLYCDVVMDEQRELLVRNAHAEPEWCANPDLKHGMSFYFGSPLNWPDGEIFGTICVLDTQAQNNAERYRGLLPEFGRVIDSDLKLLVEIAEREHLAAELKKSNDELEQRVAERTGELTIAIAELRARELEIQEVNTTLRVLLNRVEKSRAEAEEQIVQNVNDLVIPLVEKIRAQSRTTELQTHLSLLEASLRKIASSLSSRLATKFSGLTATETEIAMLVMQGMNTKEIARSISRATSTVDFHRNNIRKKLGIEQRSLSLRSFLTSLN